MWSTFPWPVLPVVLTGADRNPAALGGCFGSSLSPADPQDCGFSARKRKFPTKASAPNVEHWQHHDSLFFRQSNTLQKQRLFTIIFTIVAAFSEYSRTASGSTEPQDVCPSVRQRCWRSTGPFQPRTSMVQGAPQIPATCRSHLASQLVQTSTSLWRGTCRAFPPRWHDQSVCEREAHRQTDRWGERKVFQL